MPDSPLLQIIQDYAAQTDNKCGLTAVALSQRSGIALAQVKSELNQLYIEGKIQGPREGAHGKLIMIK